MKKTLLTFFLIVSSCFFVYAQTGGQIQINTQTGQVGYQGTINGVPVSIGGAGAAGTFFGSNNALLSLLALAQTLVARLVPFLIGVAVLAFFFFLIEFIWKGRDSATAKTQSLSGMGWAIVAIFVMVSIWGIIAFVGNIFGIHQGGSMPAFRLPGQ